MLTTDSADVEELVVTSVDLLVEGCVVIIVSGFPALIFWDDIDLVSWEKDCVVVSTAIVDAVAVETTDVSKSNLVDEEEVGEGSNADVSEESENSALVSLLIEVELVSAVVDIDETIVLVLVEVAERSVVNPPIETNDI